MLITSPIRITNEPPTYIARPLLTALVLVQGDVEAETTVGPEPPVAARQPAAGGLQILVIVQAIDVRPIVDIHVVGR